MKRILIAGTGSGCGKTTASLILMAALRQCGHSVAPYKAGPDYIDPTFHAAVCGRASHNLDAFLMTEDAIRFLLDQDADVGVIEGVMGYYDGLDAASMRCSTWALSRLTQTPAVLVADASGGAASVAAQVKGFQTLVPDSRLAAVLVNRVSGAHHYGLVREAVAMYTGLPCVGYLQRNPSLTLKSRHLGLVPAQEVPDVAARVEEAARAARETLDLPLLLRLAGQAPALAYEMPQAPAMRPFRLGVARDEAFSFYYQANLDLLARAGAELAFFSPLRDARLPEGLDALYFGGGFPEVFAGELAENASMMASVRQTLASDLPCYGECGGMMYLSRRIGAVEMVGRLPLACRMTNRLRRFGYVTVRDASGLTIPAHEFHHAVAEPQEPVTWAYAVSRARDPGQTWQGGCQVGRTLGAFAHLHFLSHPEWIRRLFA